MENYTTPHHDVQNPILSKIIFKSWPKHLFNRIEGPDECKKFYNDVYSNLIIEIGIILSKYHPAAWARIAYMELEIWTVLWMLDKDDYNKLNVDGPEHFAPAGRYGWRYILEKSLENCSNANNNLSERPNSSDINALFTLLIALTQATEISNYLHFLHDKFTSVEIEFSPFLLNGLPKLNEEESKSFNELRTYILQKNSFKSYPQFDPQNNNIFIKKVDTFLLNNWGFTIKDVEKILLCIRQDISGIASIALDTYDNIIYLLCMYTKMNDSIVKNIIDFISLDTEIQDYQKRDFLIKNQQKRMINHCGAIIKLDTNFTLIYDEVAARLQHVTISQKHLLFSPILAIEWINNFYSRIAYGQRSDLKKINKKIRLELGEIEQYVHRNIFEEELKALLTTHSYYCITINKINRVPIPCGEIDIIAYNNNTNSLLIIEAKNTAPVIDAKSIKKIIDDHFHQKEYHKKFKHKIDWVNTNITLIKEIIKEKYNVNIPETATPIPYFITGTPYIPKFIVKEYEIMTVEEFINKIISNHD